MGYLLTLFAVSLGASSLAFGGSIFLTGHDPDFHASLGGNLAGARKINQTGITYATDAAFNPFTAGGVSKFLFVESSIAAPGGHTVGKAGIVASGYTEGVDFEHHTAATLNAALDQLGSGYNAIVVASDFGGLLTQAELDILNARSADIITFLNAGGGLYALAESNSGAGLTPGGGHFGFLPFLVTGISADQNETGFTVTPFGAGLGLSDNDVNGNASHNFFPSAFGMSVVDYDAAGRIMSLAVRSRITDEGVVPEPSTYAMLGGGLGLLLLAARRRKR